VIKKSIHFVYDQYDQTFQHLYLSLEVILCVVRRSLPRCMEDRRRRITARKHGSQASETAGDSTTATTVT
jgi:hypothetical protein